MMTEFRETLRRRACGTMLETVGIEFHTVAECWAKGGCPLSGPHWRKDVSAGGRAR
jgi:hypothetical protein